MSSPPSFKRLIAFIIIDNNFLYSRPDIGKTLRSMQMTLLNTASGYIPSYTRTELTDALHKIFDFRTDNEFISKSDMRTLIKNTKSDKIKVRII